MQQSYVAHRKALIDRFKRLRGAVSGPMAAFGELHRAALADGILPVKFKELLALAAAIARPCEGCITLHVHDALKAGATREEVLETLGVSLLMGGGPGMVHCLEALQALEDFSEGAKG